MGKSVYYKKELLDTETGELVKATVFVRVWGKPDKGFTKLFDVFVEQLVLDDDIAGKAIRLLLYMIRKLPRDSLEVALVPREVMEELKISESTYYKWLKILMNKGIIEKRARNIYRLKPYTIIRGTMEKVLEDEAGF